MVILVLKFFSIVHRFKHYFQHQEIINSFYLEYQLKFFVGYLFHLW